MAVETTSSLTPALLDLMDHEKVIEQGLASFIDVGMALLAIKADKKYRHAGYSTFEDYCDQRWNIKRAHGHRLILAAVTAEQVLSPMGDIPAPESERQVRPLTLLKDDDDKRAAWAEVADLEAALARLDRYGWTKGTGGHSEQPACMIDHLSYCLPEVKRYAAAYDALRHELQRPGLLSFNDDPTTTLADVRAVFCRAIETAQSSVGGEPPSSRPVVLPPAVVVVVGVPWAALWVGAPPPVTAGVS